MKRVLLFCWVSFLTVGLVAQSTPASQYSSNIAQYWFNVELNLIKTGTGFTPPVAARALGYTGLALYESVVGGMTGYTSLQTKLPGAPVFTQAQPGTVYHWPTVANNALSDIIDSLWGNASTGQKYTIHLVKQTWNSQYQGEISTQEFNDSKALGEQIARDVFAYSTGDGGNKGYLTNTDAYYYPPVCEGCWVPTPPAYAMATQPHWGEVRPFMAVDAQSPCVPAAPPPFSTDTTSTFYAYANQVYVTRNNLAPDQVNIAHYWADAGGTITPPGHSTSILTQVLARENSNLQFAAIAYAELGMTETDAFIACWKTKYTYNLLRPVTYIRSYIDSSWSTLFATPAFPEYTSGHSVQSGAMSAVLNSLFGSNYSFTDSTNGAAFGGPRTYTCFDEAAYEAASSREYAGIHYEFSDVFGVSLGKMVGANILSLFDSVQTQPEGIASTEIHFSVHPNPTANFMLISCDKTLSRVELFDMNGRQVMIANNTYVLDLDLLAAGAYIVKAYDVNNQMLATRKVVKQ